jgi:UDP-glucose 4-epimerase
MDSVFRSCLLALASGEPGCRYELSRCPSSVGGHGTCPATCPNAMSSRIIVTGGCGYIGSHTMVELVNAGFDPISIDNNSRSSETILECISEVAGRRVANVRADLRDRAATDEVFALNRDAAAVIHFAAFKSVPESVAEPLLYYDNNIASLVHVLDCTEKYRIPNFIFSSSCSVYGNAPGLPVTEDTPFGEAASPYARSKQMGETILRDFSARARGTRCVSLRYFNPVGAHHSGLIGEVPVGPPGNLLPVITQTAMGLLPGLTVHGHDYDTRDGTCIRDYVHVCDIADAHVRAVEYINQTIDADRRLLTVDRSKGNPESGVRQRTPNTQHPGVYEVFNLGSGCGTTVLEAIRTFEKVSGRHLKYRIGPRRPGDVSAVYSDKRRAIKILGWRPQGSLEDMLRSAWRWEQNRSSLRPESAGPAPSRMGEQRRANVRSHVPVPAAT